MMVYDFLNIDKNSKVLLYEQLYNNVKTAIKNGSIKKGDKLPSVRGLSSDLSVSRTTVETAYDQLCAEGYLTRRPKRGYFVEAEQPDADPPSEISYTAAQQVALPVRYDFSTASIDPGYTDIKFWQRCIKDVLDKPYVITSYGDPQGELALRQALCEYSRRVRGVKADPDRIVIGAGTQTRLSVLLGICSDYGFDAAMEKGFFPQGEQIFRDFRCSITSLSVDKSGIILDDSVRSRILFVNSSGSIRGSSPIPVNKRLEIIRWAQTRDAVIIEDDFNGELRCTSKPVPALQGMSPSRVVYIGSFSKLLLPSVRISYMVLPPSLAAIYRERSSNYNQTSSKAEQLALAHYISCGRLDRQLRRLRKIYSEKSMIMYDAVKREFPKDTVVEIIETALCVRIKLKLAVTLDTVKEKACGEGIRLGKCREKNGLKYFYLSFAGISAEKIPDAVKALADLLLDR